MTPSTLLSRNADTLTQRRQALLALAPAACLLLINYSSTLGTQDYLAALGILVGGRILLPLIFGGLVTGTLNPYAGIAAIALFALDHHKSLLPSDLALALAIGAGSLALLVLNHLRWRVIAGFYLVASLALLMMQPLADQTALVGVSGTAIAAHSIALALMPMLLARRESTAYRPRAAWLLGGIGGIGYALLCLNYAPLFSLLVACTLTGLLQPSVAEIERRLSALPHLCAAALSIFCALILAAQGITALGAQRESLLSATAGITLCSALLIGSCLAACFAQWVAPRLSARRQQRLNAKHEAYAASNSLVLRARVTGALNRRQENE